MTPQTTRNIHNVRRAATSAVATAAVAAGLMVGLGSATAHADVLDDLAGQYSTGAGAGEIATCLHEALILRNQGYKPTPAEYQAITDSEVYKPNQVPLINALQAAVSTQRKLQQRATPPSNPVTIGINQYNPYDPGPFGGLSIGGG
jgi:hypothetical protein